MVKGGSIAAPLRESGCALRFFDVGWYQCRAPDPSGGAFDQGIALLWKNNLLRFRDVNVP